jgi:hypothetical protein
MPGLNGLRVVKKIWEGTSPADLSVVAVTVFAMEVIAKRLGSQHI